MNTNNIPSNNDILSSLQTGAQVVDRLTNVAAVSKERQMLNQTKEVLRDTQDLISSKNKGEKWQKFIAQLIKFLQDMSNDQVLAAEFRRPSTTRGESVPDVGAQFLHNLRVVGIELIRSGELRSLLAEIMDTLDQLFNASTVFEGDSSVAKSNVSLYDSVGTTNYSAGLQQKEGEFSWNYNSKPIGSELGKSGDLKKDIKKEWSNLKWGQMDASQRRELDQNLRQLRGKFRGLLIRLSYNPNWKQAMNSLFELIDALQQEASQKGKVVDRRVLDNKHLLELVRQGAAIIEEFTGKEAFENCVESIDGFIDEVINDEGHRAFLSDWKTWAQEIMMNPDRLETEDYQQKFDQLIDRGYVLREQIRPVLQSLQFLFDSARYDAETMKLVQDTEEMAELLISGFEDPKVRAHIRNILTNLFVDQFKTIQLPAIQGVYEGTFGNYEYIIDGIVLNTFDVLPDFMQVRMYNNVETEFKTLSTRNAENYLSFTIEGINADMKNLDFAYKKIGSDAYDRGLVDVKMENANLVCEVYVHAPAFDSFGYNNLFTVKRVDFNIDSLKVHTHEAKWSTLYNMFSGFLTSSVKQKIKDRVEFNINHIIDTLNLKLHQMSTFVPQAKLKDLVLNQFLSVEYY